MKTTNALWRKNGGSFLLLVLSQTHFSITGRFSWRLFSLVALEYAQYANIVLSHYEFAIVYWPFISKYCTGRFVFSLLLH
jgi:hypothetical protein